jgi:hypothetical protein
MKLIIEISERKEYDGTVLAIYARVDSPSIDTRNPQLEDITHMVELGEHLREETYSYYQKKGIPLAPIRTFKSSNSSGNNEVSATPEVKQNLTR